MSTTAKWVIGIVVGLIFIFGIFIFVMMSWMFSDEGDGSIGAVGDKLAVIDLKEEIYFSEEIVRQFKKYRENSSVRAIVFRIESPGGGVAASQEIFEEVKKTRDSGKPVVVSMGSVAASGGYYVACAADKIVANPGTLTGSIGVISHFLSFEPLMKKVGVEETTIKTGKFKDIGSPFRKATEEDKQYFNSVISDVYDQFVDAIEEERGLERAQILKYADGRVFTGRQAVEYGFVDTLGTMEDAVSIAAELGDIKGRPNIIKETKRKAFFERIIGDAAAEVTKIGHEFLRSPVLQYRFVSPD